MINTFDVAIEVMDLVQLRAKKENIIQHFIQSQVYSDNSFDSTCSAMLLMKLGFMTKSDYISKKKSC